MPESTLAIDCASTRAVRPPDSNVWRTKRPTRKKFTSYSTSVMATPHGMVVFHGRPASGGRHDLTLLKDGMPDFKPREKMAREWTSDKPPVTLLGDPGFLVMEKYAGGVAVTLPHKRKPGRTGPAEAERGRNEASSGARAGVEHAIRRVRRHARVADPYAGTEEEFGYDSGIAAGLANVHLTWPDTGDGRCELG